MIVVATCADWPEPSKSEALLVAALRARGTEVSAAPWNGPEAAFDGADLVLLRACWDYHKSPQRFLAWLDRLEARGLSVLNPPALVRWNFDKRYLLALQAAGIRVPGTRIVPSNDHAAIAAAMREAGWAEAVLKPISGQSGFHVELLRLAERADWPVSAMPTETALLQSFIADIGRLGEVALIFFDGRFSHAVRKLSAPGEWRSNSQYGGTYEAATVDPATIAAAEAALAAAPFHPLYARVDGVEAEADFTVMELELIEPGLFLDSDEAAAGRFADAVLARI